jgi:hypothetical protein
VLLAARHTLPDNFSSNDHVTADGPMSHGPDQADPHREAGTKVGTFQRLKPNAISVAFGRRWKWWAEIILERPIGDPRIRQ